MKNRLLLALLFLATFSFGQKPVFKIRYAEQLAVFVFMQELSPDHRDNVFKTAFQQSAYHVEKYINILAEFDALNIDYSYPFDGFPYGSKSPMQTRDVLKKNLIETTSLTDFKLRSIGILPNKTLNDLTRCIAEFTPIYNELIYNPNKAQFEKQLMQITNYASAHQMESYFETGLQFYNSNWDNTIPFEIAFYPLPNSKGFTAQAFYNNFISAIQTNLTDYKDLFSVMLHETFHIIYDEQSLEMKTQIGNYFRNNKSDCSLYAYRLLNEVLATALGNGYVYEQLNGKRDENDWYYHPYINAMAKKIYPLVTDYIAQKKPMDQAFVDNYIQLYEANFPNWINELENIMTYRYVIAENEADFGTISQMFWYRSNEEQDDQFNANSLEKMRETPLTKLIIVSGNNAEKLTLIKKTFPELNKWKFKAGEDFSYMMLLADRTQLIILNQQKSTVETLLKGIQ